MTQEAYTKLIYNNDLAHDYKCRLRHYMHYMTDDEIGELFETL